MAENQRDVIQIEPQKSYGSVQYSRTLAVLARHGWPRSLLFPHGGNQMSMAIRRRLRARRRGILSQRVRRLRRLCRRRARGERVHHAVGPGIGFEGQAAINRIMRELAGI
jgi:D(-)-tartrate dehydratase